MMLRDDLLNVGLSDLEKLVADGVHEGKTIEYKREFYALNAPEPGKTVQHKELLKDIASFANTLGGDLIIGVRTENGVPIEVCGFEEPNPDGLKLKISQLAQDWLEPRISMTIHSVEHSPGRIVIVIRMQRSIAGPHRVVYRNEFGQFWFRNSGGAVAMDTTELRQAFTLSQTLYEKIRAFRRERVELIRSGETPVLLTQQPKLVLHLIPQDSYVSHLQFPSIQFRLLPLPVIPDSGGWSGKFNMDGFVSFDRHSDASGYTQVFRNGIIEAVCDGVVVHHEQDLQKQNPLFRTSDLQNLFRVLPSYLQTLRQLSISPPIWCFLTIIGMKGVRILNKSASFYMSPIDREILWFPEIQIDDYEIGRPDVFLRPLMDMLWQAAGDPSCPFYTKEGHFAL
jgi:hypothetical protein